jgi:hypothetical protein
MTQGPCQCFYMTWSSNPQLVCLAIEIMSCRSKGEAILLLPLFLQQRVMDENDNVRTPFAMVDNDWPMCSSGVEMVEGRCHQEGLESWQDLHLCNKLITVIQRPLLLHHKTSKQTTHVYYLYHHYHCHSARWSVSTSRDASQICNIS